MKKREKAKNVQAQVRVRARMLTHSQENREFQCELCEYKSNDKANFRKHLASHLSEKPFACTVCNFRCKLNQGLKKHIKRKHLGDRPYMCSKCDYRGHDKSELLSHERGKHSDVKLFSCRFCDFTAKYKGGVKNHETSMHVQSSEIFNCDRCNFKTVDEKRYMAHLKAHEQNISLSCTICLKSFMLQRDFRDHMRRHKKPNNPKKKPCPKCDQEFNSTQALRSHLFIHTGMMDYKCRICGSGFRLYESLAKHHMKKHPGESVFRCDPCNFQTDHKKVYNQHTTMVSHLQKVAAS